MWDEGHLHPAQHASAALRRTRRALALAASAGVKEEGHLSYYVGASAGAMAAPGPGGYGGALANAAAPIACG
jgi:hypothetical protein